MTDGNIFLPVGDDTAFRGTETTAAEVRLSALETECMSAWNGCDPDYGYFSFAGIDARCMVPSYNIRRVTRALARKGLVQFAKGLSDDAGEFRGSGYGLTKAGESWLAVHSTTPIQTEDSTA